MSRLVPSTIFSTSSKGHEKQNRCDDIGTLGSFSVFITYLQKVSFASLHFDWCCCFAFSLAYNVIHNFGLKQKEISHTKKLIWFGVERELNWTSFIYAHYLRFWNWLCSVSAIDLYAREKIFENLKKFGEIHQVYWNYHCKTQSLYKKKRFMFLKTLNKGFFLF